MIRVNLLGGPKPKGKRSSPAVAIPGEGLSLAFKALVVLALVACGGSSSSQQSSAAAPPAAPSTSQAPAQPAPQQPPVANLQVTPVYSMSSGCAGATVAAGPGNDHTLDQSAVACPPKSSP